jgi:hypothetical protein
MDNSILKIDNLNFGKSKTKWEVIGKLSEVYLKTGDQLRLDTFANYLKEKHVDVTKSLQPIEKYRAEVLELIKILVNSPAQ